MVHMTPSGVSDCALSDEPCLLLLVAMPREVRALLPHWDDCTTLAIEGCPFVIHKARVGQWSVVLVQSGIGKVNAALATLQGLRLFPNAYCVANVGCSGGLRPGSRVGDCYIGAEYVYHDVWCGEGNLPGQVQGLPPVYKATPQLVERVSQLRTSYPIEVGTFCCGDAFIPNREALEAVLKQFPGCCSVDMESAAIAQTCYLYGVPFVSLRVVSDTPLSCHDHNEQYCSFWRNNPEQYFAVLPKFIEQISSLYAL